MNRCPNELNAVPEELTGIAALSKRNGSIYASLNNGDFATCLSMTSKLIGYSTHSKLNDTVSADRPLVPLINLLKPIGKLVLVVAPSKPFELPAFPLLFGMN